MKTILLLTGVLLFAERPMPLHGQAFATALRPADISTSAGIEMTDVGIGGATQKSLVLSNNSTLYFKPRWCLGTEIRTMEPMQFGSVSIRSAMAGVRMSAQGSHFAPYATALAGRGELLYAGDGMRTPNQRVSYTQSGSNMFSLGSGLHFNLLKGFGFRLGQEFDHLRTPVTSSGKATASSWGFGIDYHPPDLHRGHPY